MSLNFLFILEKGKIQKLGNMEVTIFFIFWKIFVIYFDLYFFILYITITYIPTFLFCLVFLVNHLLGFLNDVLIIIIPMLSMNIVFND